MASSVYDLFPIVGGKQLIRVLDIHADSSTTAELKTSLRVVSLRDSPRFTALSYVWGNKTDRDPMLRCSEYYISITVNCYEALQSLRDLYGNLTVWVDAICIRQTDQAEKSSQILLMEEIYSWAEVVYVWLGNGTPQTDRAMDWIRSTPKDVRCLEGIGIVSASTVRERMKSAVYLVQDLYWTYLDSMGWFTECTQYSPFRKRFRKEDFQELLSREWAERIWTFQEIILACNAVFVCGTKAVPWNDFIRAVAVAPISSGEPKTILDIQRDKWQSIARLWMDLERKSRWNHRQIRRSLPARQHVSRREPGVGSFSRYQELAKGRINLLLSSVHGLIMLSLIAFCSTIIVLFSTGTWPFHSLYGTMPNGTVDLAAINPQTTAIVLSVVVLSLYVFTMIGCFMGLRNFTMGGRLRLVPNTRGDKTASRIDGSAYQHIQRAIRTRRAGDPRDKSYGLYGVLKASGVRLAQASYRKPVGLIYQELCLDLLHWGRSLNLILDAGLPAFAATASWTPRWDLADTPARAWLDLTYIYSVHGQQTASSSLSIWRIGADSRLIIRGCFRGTVIFRSESFRSGQDIASKFLDAFNEIRFRMRLLTESDTIFAALLEVLYARVKSRTPPDPSDLFHYWFQSLVAASSMMASTRVQLSHWRELIQRNRAAKQYHKDIGEQLTGRILLVTSDGLLGTGSSAIAVGDQIVLGSGIAMPLVLRRNGASGLYTLVGPAFIHGMMEGEMWTGEDLEDVVLI